MAPNERGKMVKVGQRAPAHGVKKVTDYKQLAANHDIDIWAFYALIKS